jgi:hypothetical protein
MRLSATLRREIDLPALGWGAALIAPFVVVAALTGDQVFLQLCFLAVCLLIPAYQLLLPPLATAVHTVATVATCTLLFAAAAQPLVFVIVTATSAITTIWLTRYGGRLRTLGTFFFIPALYLACELHELPDGTSELGRLVLLSPIAGGAVIAVELTRRWVSGIRAPMSEEHGLATSLLRGVEIGEAEGRWVTHSVAVFVAVLVATAIAEAFDMDQRQWVIWSSITVITGDHRAAIGKFGIRATGVAIGAPLGLLAGWLLPQTQFVYSLALLALLLTLLAIPRYPVAFTLRSFFTGLAAMAAGGAASIAESRVENVILGGIIGVLALLVVAALRRELPRRPVA